MEKITASQFGKFDGFGVGKLNAIKGGMSQETGAGQACLGNQCVDYRSDTINGSSTTYRGLSVAPRQDC